MSNNEIKSTLFRFINVRNPHRPRRSAIESGFIQQDVALLAGPFHLAVRERPEGVTRREALRSAAARFDDSYISEVEVQAAYPEMHGFAEWILRNRASYTQEDLVSQARKVSTFKTGDLKDVWDHLFYQLVTQKSFYVKEALMQLLLANHVVKNMDSSSQKSEHNDNLMNARVTLPTELFAEEELQEPELSKPGEMFPELPDDARKKQLEVVKAEFANTRLNTLKKELQKLEAEYKREYQKNYALAEAAHEADIAPIIEKYNMYVEDARKKYCSLNPGAAYDPNDPCNQPDYIPYPELPDFDFSFKPEIDLNELEGRLSYESYITLLETLGQDFEEEVQRNGMAMRTMSLSHQIAEPDSYMGIVEQHINPLIVNNNNTINNNTVISNPQVSVGGVTVPVTLPTILLDSRYSVCSVRSGLSVIYNIAIGLPAELNILKTVVTQQNSNGSSVTHIINAPATTRVNNVLQLNNAFTYTFPNGTFQNAPTFDFDLHLTNGEVKSIRGIEAIMAYCVRGFAITSGTAPAPVVVTPVESFIPSGYGVRQLGIADYLKVEQSVQCYVEGEVSHIENVMAREYKEKSSRRLLRTEDTTTTSTETEREQLTDTVTTDRYEMQSEVAQVIQENRDMSASVSAGYSGGGYTINTGLGLSSSTSKEDSIRQAVTQAREITERAMEKVVSKVKQERIRKVVEEFEENNKHGFDNRKGPKHVVGVYRWIDKIYKNQILNYGKRLMFEFMIPDPARLHMLSADNGPEIIPPVDPRTADVKRVTAYTALTEDFAAFWASQYNVELETYPKQNISIGKAFAYGQDMVPNPTGATSAVGLKHDVEIPEGYETVSYTAVGGGKPYGSALAKISVGNKALTQSATPTAIPGFTGTVPVSIATDRYYSFQVNVAINCVLTMEAKKEWQQKSFKAIIDAYEEKLAEFNLKMAEENSKAKELKRTNPGFYRQIENIILRKNCISYMIDRNPLSVNTYGKAGLYSGTKFTDTEVNMTPTLSGYAGFAKFMEQAFEWEIMSYNFYPYYWGPKDSWLSKHQFDDSSDPVFRSFIQAGMARVIVTVRPGFEEAVQYYLTTGTPWMGGAVPSIGDPLYMSIVQEIRQPAGELQGKAWLTRVPTSLTILQADSIGLRVERALPCNCENIEDFENPELVPCSDTFTVNQYLIGVDPDAPDTYPEEPEDTDAGE